MECKFKVGNTTYQRSKRYGVGKEIGGKIYVHKNYYSLVISPNQFFEAASLLPYGFVFNCLMIDKKKSTIRFDEAPDFDTAREPHPGDSIEINLITKEIRKRHSDFIWHHKWMWVDDDYAGFDVDESYRWSQQWTKIIHNPSGSQRIWGKQLNSIV